MRSLKYILDLSSELCKVGYYSNGFLEADVRGLMVAGKIINNFNSFSEENIIRNLI